MALLKAEEVRALSAPSAWRSSLAIALDWLLIAANFALAARFPNPVVWCFCFVFAARQQLALAILMHDGSHRRLFKSTAWNDWMGQFLCAAPLIFSLYSYQRLHLKHHRDPLAPDDPDLSLTGGYPISRSSFLRKLARDAFGLSYVKFIRYFIHLSRQPKKAKNPKSEVGIAGARKPEREVGPPELKSQLAGKPMSAPWLAFSILSVNLTLWSVLYSFGHGWHYLFFWFLPAITALQVLLRIRGITEHAGYQPNPDQRVNARTVINPLQTFLFAPHNVNYHIEHHVYPAVPFHNLPKLHSIMKSRNLIPEANIYPGYGKVLSELIQ